MPVSPVSQQRNVIREKPPPEVGSAGCWLLLRVILTNRDYVSPNIFFKMMKQFPNSILIKKKKKVKVYSVARNPPANPGDL